MFLCDTQGVLVSGHRKVDFWNPRGTGHVSPQLSLGTAVNDQVPTPGTSYFTIENVQFNKPLGGKNMSSDHFHVGVKSQRRSGT